MTWDFILQFQGKDNLVCSRTMLEVTALAMRMSVLQFQYTIYRPQSPAFSSLHCRLRKYARQHNWLKILVLLHGCSNENAVN